jgi:hypothetical protein
MIVEPEQRIPDFVKAGADIISVHAEQSSTIHLHRVVNQVRAALRTTPPPPAGPRPLPPSRLRPRRRPPAPDPPPPCPPQIKDLGVKAGVVLNPGTPLSTIEYVLSEVDLVLIMSVNPGFGGQKFIESQVTKIRELKAMCNKLVGSPRPPPPCSLPPVARAAEPDPDVLRAQAPRARWLCAPCAPPHPAHALPLGPPLLARRPARPARPPRRASTPGSRWTAA